VAVLLLDREVASDKGCLGTAKEHPLAACGITRRAMWPYSALRTTYPCSPLVACRFPRGASASLAHLPTDVGELYNQARSCMAVSGYTGAVLVDRKLLMHIAVTQGADENRRSSTTWTTSPRTAS
jgi:hypothetical protein